MNHWIFVIRDDESIFKKRIQNKIWPIFSGTKLKTFLEVGDDVVFYQAGLEGQKFIGTAILKSELITNPEKIDSYIEIDEIDIWKKPLSIRELISKLNLIKNKTHWGLYLQGGILPLNDKDYTLIIKESKKSKRKN